MSFGTPFWKLTVLLFIFVNAAIADGSQLYFKNQTIDAKEAMTVMGLDASASGSSVIRFPQYKEYVLQFKNIPTEEDKRKIEDLGVRFFGYIPDNAYIVQMASDSVWSQILNLDLVEAILPYFETLKVSQDLPVPSVFNQNDIVSLMLQTVGTSETSKVIKDLTHLGVENIISISESSMTVNTKIGLIPEIARIAGVLWVESAPEIQTAELELNASNLQSDKMVGNYKDLTGYETGTKLMGFEAAWRNGYDGRGVVVGITDTGLDRGAQNLLFADFQGQVIGAYGLSDQGVDFWKDEVGHGTHTAGSIVGNGRQSGGLIKGGAFGAKLVAQGLGKKIPKSLIQKIGQFFTVPFTQHHASIYSNSWSAKKSEGKYDILTSEVDSAMWKNPEILIIFCSGNEAADFDRDGHIDFGSVGSPGTAKNVLTVGASKNYVLRGGYQFPIGKTPKGPLYFGVEPLASSKYSDNPMGMAPFSSTGPTFDGRTKPDIVAPGTNILSTRSQEKSAGVLWGEYNRYYTFSGGTSMSTPLTAAAAAVASQYAKAVLKTPPSGSLVKAILAQTAFDLYPGQFGVGKFQEFSKRRPNNYEGFGRVDVSAIMNRPLIMLDQKNGVRFGETVSFVRGLENVKLGQTIRVTMAFTDAPAVVSAAKASVNDIDLSVIDPAGGVHYPNHGSKPDSINSIEMVEFKADLEGAYKIVVKGTNIPMPAPSGGQPFSLVWEAL